MRRRRGTRRAVGARAPALLLALSGQRWSLDFVHGQLATGRRFRMLNIVDDVTRERLRAVVDRGAGCPKTPVRKRGACLHPPGKDRPIRPARIEAIRIALELVGLTRSMAQNEAVPLVKSAVRAIDVLEFVANAERPPSHTELAAGLGIPNSSLFYLLRTLSRRAYLRQNDRGNYMLGPSLLTLASSVNRISWARAVEPLIERTWTEVLETTSYFERRGDEMECISAKLAQHSLMPVHRVGQRSPLYIFSGGKIFLAEMTDDEFDAYLARTKLEKFTPYTLSTPAKVRREVASVRASRIAITREEHSLGTIGVSVGLRSNGKLIGTLGVAIPAVRFDDVVLERISIALKHAAGSFEAPGEDGI